MWFCQSMCELKCRAKVVHEFGGSGTMITTIINQRVLLFCIAMHFFIFWCVNFQPLLSCYEIFFWYARLNVVINWVRYGILYVLPLFIPLLLMQYILPWVSFFVIRILLSIFSSFKIYYCKILRQVNSK
jgi:hypothetical protein